MEKPAEGYCTLADLDAAEYDRTRTGLWTRGLLIAAILLTAISPSSRPGARPEPTSPHWSGSKVIAGRSSQGTPPAEREGVAAEGIEDSFETTKNELGLDHNETRSWRSLQEAPRGKAVWSCKRRYGWHRHVSLVMLAFAMMAVVRHKTNALPPPKTLRRMTKLRHA